jgi:hypothetical protein
MSADLRLSTSVSLRYGELSLWVDATNITNRSNDCCVDLNSMSGPSAAPGIVDQIWSPRHQRGLFEAGTSTELVTPQMTVAARG